MNDGQKISPRIVYTNNTDMIERAKEIAFYDFPGKMFVNKKRGRITFLDKEAEEALPELTGNMS
jgi:hypothetical protein